MNETELAALRKKAIKDIVPELPGLADDALRALTEAEQGAENPRESLLAALAAEAQRRAPLNTEEESGEGGARSDGAPGGSPSDKGSAAAAKEPAFLAEDYTGPLTIDQAERRLAKFGAVYKPARAPTEK